MAIKVNIPAGASNVTVKGLYQWDYGQVLEIESAEIGSEILEAHFACPNMNEAIVRVCTFTNGIGTVTIPDECLEQVSSVNVWLCTIDETQRHTIKTIVLPITQRTRPSNTRDVPADYTDKYGQLIEEVNEAIEAIENGNVTAANALLADTAKYATTAGNAENATYATSAGSAKSATSASYTSSVLGSCAASISINSGEGSTSALLSKRIYFVVFDNGNGFSWSGVICVKNAISISYIGEYILQYWTDGTVTLNKDGTGADGTLYFYKIGEVA